MILSMQHSYSIIKLDEISQIATYLLKYSQYKMQYHTIHHANVRTSRHTHDETLARTPSRLHPHTPTHPHTHTPTHPHTHTHTHTHTRTHARTHTHTHTHAHTHVNRIKNSIPQQILNLMYNSLILPHIYFCITAWGFKCNRIFTLQKKSLRIITKSKFNSHTEPLFRELSMLKVEHIFQMQCLKLYYNVINERTPDFFSNMLKLKGRMHSHETRQKNYIHIAGTRTICKTMHQTIHTNCFNIYTNLSFRQNHHS